MRTIEFRNDYSPDELAKKLLDAGFSGDTRIDTIAAGLVNHEAFDGTDETIEMECVVDEDDVLEALGDKAIVDAAADIRTDAGEDRAIEDGIRYVRSGELALAGAMFERVFEGADLRAAERALS